MAIGLKGRKPSRSRAKTTGRSRSVGPASLAAIGAALLTAAMASSVSAAACRFVGGPQFGGIEPPLAVDGDCTDPDYNETTFVLDGTEQKSLSLPGGATVAYTEVKGHFPAAKTVAMLPRGISQSPTTARHDVTWRFPDKGHWKGRFFQQSYPLPFEALNTADSAFAFTNGGYTVGITPGNPNVGYRVPAAAAKLAKSYATRLYGNRGRIYGYIWGQSGGSVQMMGANEGTIGVWDGIVPVVIATDGLNAHAFMWDGLYALAVPEAKRKAIAEAVAPGSGRNLYAGVTVEERAVLNELLNAGFARRALEDMQFKVEMALLGAGSISAFDPAYEDDFWSKPGYEGVEPPAYLTAAKVDGMATVTGVTRDAKNVPTGLTFDPATVPALGSIGDAGLQFYVYAADGTTRVTKGDARTLNGTLHGNTLALTGRNDPALLEALVTGGVIRINNRFVLAACFYPRHAILDNGSPAYNQYRNADRTPKYVQRSVQVAYIGNVRSAGGRRETGHLKTKTIVIENLADAMSYPYVAGWYEGVVRKAMGPAQADETFRVYYNENAIHYAGVGFTPSGAMATTTADAAGILHQALLDLTAWVERGIAPLPSTRYRIDGMNQVVLPERASERRGHQPVVHLTANGGLRAEVGVNQPVTLVGTIEMPPGAGKIVRYDWYLGTGEFSYEPATKLDKPLARVGATRTISFGAPGEYTITLRAVGQRTGNVDSATALQNLARVRIAVH